VSKNAAEIWMKKITPLLPPKILGYTSTKEE
jgi:hypothetical protein